MAYDPRERTPLLTAVDLVLQHWGSLQLPHIASAVNSYLLPTMLDHAVRLELERARDKFVDSVPCSDNAMRAAEVSWPLGAVYWLHTVGNVAFSSPDLVLHRASRAKTDREGRVAQLVAGQCAPLQLQPALCTALKRQRFNVAAAVISAAKPLRTTDEGLYFSTMEAGIKTAIECRLWGKARLLVPFVRARSCPDIFSMVISDYVEPSLPRELVTALIAKCPCNANYSILLDYAFAARRMDAVDLVLEMRGAEPDEAIALLIKSERWNEVAPLIDKHGCGAAIPGEVVLSAARNGDWGHVKTMMPFSNEKLDVLLEIAVRECQGEIIGSLCAAKTSDGKPYFSTEKIRAVMSIAANRGCQVTMALVYPSCCKSLIAGACSDALKEDKIRTACRPCLGFAMDVAVASHDFELAEKIRTKGDVMRDVTDPRGYRYAKKLVAAKLYQKALALVERGLNPVFAPLVLDLLPDSVAGKNRLNFESREYKYDDIVEMAAIYGEWDVLLESLNGCKALSTVECALSTACKKSRWDVAERIASECRLVSRSRMLTMLKNIGSALGRTTEAQAVVSNLRKQKRGGSRVKRQRVSSR